MVSHSAVSDTPWTITHHAQSIRRCGFNFWVGKILWKRACQPTPVFLPGKSHGQRSLAGHSPWGCKELDTIEWLNNNRHVLLSPGLSCSGDEPLQDIILHPVSGTYPLADCLVMWPFHLMLAVFHSCPLLFLVHLIFFPSKTPREQCLLSPTSSSAITIFFLFHISWFLMLPPCFLLSSVDFFCPFALALQSFTLKFHSHPFLCSLSLWTPVFSSNF